eukprot:8292085-Pyramimonas_sp.AAC.1
MPATHAVATARAMLDVAPYAGLTEDQQSRLDKLTMVLKAMQLREQVGQWSCSGGSRSRRGCQRSG